MISKLIFNRLKDAFSDRVYPHTTPPTIATYPLCTYKVEDTTYVRVSTGNTNTSINMVDFAVIALAYSQIIELKTVLFGLLDMVRFVAGEVVCKGSYIESDSIDISEITELGKTYHVFSFTAKIIIDE